MICYFRAPDAATVAASLEPDGDLDGFEGTEGSGIDPAVVLGRLVAAINEVRWSVDLVGDRPIWPDPGPDGPDEFYDPLAEGPMVCELNVGARDALASLTDERLPDVVAQWARSEELAGVNADDLMQVTVNLRELSRRAKAADEMLYCWVCL
jgi:hypothetical protein